ncbi:MAG TPA: MarR family transcriptional regulator [Burkholderiaceae bacterium]|nr:MarR family transcriptional regulator [Burkholderiaceae bacterium]
MLSTMTQDRSQHALADGDLSGLYARPGFLFRRAHQIAVGIFVQEAEPLALNPPQHSALYAVLRRPGIDQSALGRALGFDRATIGIIVGGLESRGLLRRQEGTDRRRKSLTLTPAGRQMLSKAAAAASRTTERLMAPLSAAERRVFLELLARITDELNAQSRSPLETGAGSRGKVGTRARAA